MSKIDIYLTTDNGQQTTDKVTFKREQRLLAGSAEHSNFNEVNCHLSGQTIIQRNLTNKVSVSRCATTCAIRAVPSL